MAGNPKSVKVAPERVVAFAPVRRIGERVELSEDAGVVKVAVFPKSVMPPYWLVRR